MNDDWKEPYIYVPTSERYCQIPKIPKLKKYYGIGKIGYDEDSFLFWSMLLIFFTAGWLVGLLTILQ